MQCCDKTHLWDALRNDITIAVRSPRACGGAMISFYLLGGGTRMDGDGVGVDYAVKGLFTVWPLYIKHLD